MVGSRPNSLTLFFLSFFVLWAAAWLGARLRGNARQDEERRHDFSLILAATLTLLGLLIGFSFSMAASRYDQRKNLEEAEANAIGTEYLRAELLAPADRGRVRTLLKKYLDLRIRFYEADARDDDGISAQISTVQSDLWAAVVAPGTQRPSPISALVVTGMNDVINAQSYTQAAWWNRVPLAAGVLMLAIAILCNLMVGYGSRSIGPHSVLLAMLPCSSRSP